MRTKDSSPVSLQKLFQETLVMVADASAQLFFYMFKGAAEPMVGQPRS